MIYVSGAFWLTYDVASDFLKGLPQGNIDRDFGSYHKIHPDGAVVVAVAVVAVFYV